MQVTVDDSPIFDRLEDAWHGVTSHGRQDAAGVRRVWQQLTHHDSAATPAAAATGKAATAMTLTEIYDRFKADADADVVRAKEYAEQHLPALAAFAQAAASNPLVAAALNIVHLQPDFLNTLASVITEADSKLGAAKQAAADAEAAQQAALAAAAPPEPAPAEEVPAA